MWNQAYAKCMYMYVLIIIFFKVKKKLQQI